MSELELTPVNSEVDVTVSFEVISDELGEQYILSKQDERDFAYMAGIALETADDNGYQLIDALMEFIRNSSRFSHVSATECNEIEMLLRGE